jgi:hypothetical protein
MGGYVLAQALPTCLQKIDNVNDSEKLRLEVQVEEGSRHTLEDDNKTWVEVEFLPNHAVPDSVWHNPEVNKGRVGNPHKSINDAFQVSLLPYMLLYILSYSLIYSIIFSYIFS